MAAVPPDPPRSPHSPPKDERPVEKKEKSPEREEMEILFSQIIEKQDFYCPIRHTLMTKNPVSLQCGHNFGKSAIDAWFEKNKNRICPICKKDSPSYSENRFLKNAIENWKKLAKPEEEPEDELPEEPKSPKAIISADDVKRKLGDILQIYRLGGEGITVAIDMLLALQEEYPEQSTFTSVVNQILKKLGQPSVPSPIPPYMVPRGVAVPPAAAPLPKHAHPPVGYMHASPLPHAPHPSAVGYPGSRPALSGSYPPPVSSPHHPASVITYYPPPHAPRMLPKPARLPGSSPAPLPYIPLKQPPLPPLIKAGELKPPAVAPRLESKKREQEAVEEKEEAGSPPPPAKMARKEKEDSIMEESNTIAELFRLASIGSIQAFKAALEADLAQSVDEEGQSLLHKVVLKEREVKFLDLLVAKGLSVNVTNRQGSTPLHLAAQISSIRLIKGLFKLGADKKIANLAGQTPDQMCNGKKAEKIKALFRDG